MRSKSILKEFYHDYWFWLTNNADQHDPYSRSMDLPAAIRHFCKERNLSVKNVLCVYNDQIREAGLPWYGPFDYTSYDRVEERYLNKKMRAWVKDKLTMDDTPNNPLPKQTWLCVILNKLRTF